MLHVEFDASLLPVADSTAAWKSARADLALSIEQLAASSASSSSVLPPACQLLVLVDDNMFYASMRRQYLQMARAHAAAFVILDCSAATVDACLLRNSLRTDAARRVPDDVVRRMAERLEPPIASELPFVVRVAPDFHFDAPTSEQVDAVFDAIRVCAATSRPLSLQEEADQRAAAERQSDADRELVRENRRHRRELRARALIGELIRATPAAQRAHAAHSLNERKRVLMSTDDDDDDDDDEKWLVVARAALTDSAPAREI